MQGGTLFIKMKNRMPGERTSRGSMVYLFEQGGWGEHFPARLLAGEKKK